MAQYVIIRVHQAGGGGEHKGQAGLQMGRVCRGGAWNGEDRGGKTFL